MMDEAQLFPDGRESWMEGILAAKKIDPEDERYRPDVWLTLIPLVHGYRVCVADEGDSGIEYWCYTGDDMFDQQLSSLLSWVRWPLDPVNWTRHVNQGYVEYPNKQ